MSARHFILISLVTAFAVACNTGKDKTSNGTPDPKALASLKDSANFTTIQWLDSSRNFGKVKEGPQVSVTFRFKNTGNKPLVIADVRPGCGCTVAEKPTKPIMPGEESEIKAAFETKGHTGMNNKNIMVEANTRPVQQFELKFSVEVEK